MKISSPTRSVPDYEMTKAISQDSFRRVYTAQKNLLPGWYAHSKSVGVRTGPHPSEKKAMEAMRLGDGARVEQRILHGTDYPYPYDMLVWQEKPSRVR